MKGTTILAMLATVSLLACGKTEAPAIVPPVQEVPLQAEPAPVESAPVAPAPADPVVAPLETAPATQPVVAPPAAPAKATPPIAETPAQLAPASPASKADRAHGQQVYQKACAFCHDKGVAGAPKTGDTVAWSPRLKQGMDTLYNTAIRGKGAMPAKGGNPSLADADVKAAVDFLASQSR